MKTYDIKTQGESVFPGTYGYKLYEKAAEKLHKTIRHQINFDNQVLKEVQKLILSISPICNDTFLYGKRGAFKRVCFGK